MSYDQLDWHVGEAIEAGQPPGHGFTHIGLYLAWLIRNDLHDPGAFPAAHVAMVLAGEMTGTDLADDIDGKLVGAVLSPRGRAFSDTCYEAYLDGYQSVFGNDPPYSVADDEAARARIDPVLAGLYARWAGTEAPISATRPLPGAPGPTIPDAGSPGRSESDGAAAARALAADDLERLIPRDLTSPPPDITSVSAAEWDSSLLRRALNRLGVRPTDATVVDAMGGRGDETLVVALFSVPGVVRERLLDEFRSVIYIPRGSWATRVVGARSVHWMTIPEFSTAFWALDGLVVQVSGRADLVEAAIPRLP